ncbi:hypothetical protein [Empedobacter sedimenti]|uniref:hypothetical protein n=1 Tax=Empedobacter sedimenti TaxID=3042610 RepID=UPI0024A672FA|nr:hypothetical protein [Empedobacter sedimenti]
MVKYLLVAFSFLTIVSCSTETLEEDLVETNEKLFPKGYFSNRYFTDNSIVYDSVQIIYDEQNRPIERNTKLFGSQISTEKIIYSKSTIDNALTFEIIQDGVSIEKGTYRLKSFFNQKIIQKLTSKKEDSESSYFYEDIKGDTVLKSAALVRDNELIKENYYWNRNVKYPHLTNLDSIVSFNESTKMKAVTRFKYDDHQNPFIRLGVFEDVNYRNLSFNNFVKKTIIFYDENDKKISTIEYETTFKYKNGKVDLTK